MPVTLAANALTTAAAVYDELGITMPETPSDRVLRLINAASQRVENHLQRQLQRKIFTEESPEQVQGSGGVWLFLSRWPIEDIDKVLVDESEVEFGRSDEYDRKGMLQRAAGWPRRTGRDALTGDPRGERAFNVSVAYTGGYKLPNDEGDGIPLPADLEQVVLNEIVLEYRAPRHHVTEETTAGGRRLKYATSAPGAKVNFHSADAESALLPYKRKFTGNP